MSDPRLILRDCKVVINWPDRSEVYEVTQVVSLNVPYLAESKPAPGQFAIRVGEPASPFTPIMTSDPYGRPISIEIRPLKRD
jgi:hypothetical protein